MIAMAAMAAMMRGCTMVQKRFLGAVMQKTRGRCRNATSRAFAKASARTGDAGRNAKMQQAKERCDKKKRTKE